MDITSPSLFGSGKLRQLILGFTRFPFLTEGPLIPQDAFNSSELAGRGQDER